MNNLKYTYAWKVVRGINLASKLEQKKKRKLAKRERFLMAPSGTVFFRELILIK